MDNLTKTGAEDLARQIERYWHRQGFTSVRAWTEPCGDGRQMIYAVRTNLLNGNPPTGYANGI